MLVSPWDLPTVLIVNNFLYSGYSSLQTVSTAPVSLRWNTSLANWLPTPTFVEVNNMSTWTILSHVFIQKHHFILPMSDISFFANNSCKWHTLGFCFPPRTILWDPLQQHRVSKQQGYLWGMRCISHSNKLTHHSNDNNKTEINSPQWWCSHQKMFL